MKNQRERAILVACHIKSRRLDGRTSGQHLTPEESLEELASLACSAGAEVVDRVIQERERIDSAYYIGSGKLQELRERILAKQAETVVFDENLSPAQQRNIERQLDSKVIDRTQLILDIFAARARTREGKLQVELAQLNYLLPRLAGKGIELSRLGGGIGTRGPGETKLETDQRKIHSRIHKIERALERVKAHRRLHRSFRSTVPVPTISLVGYTNAGKSTLFNALTQADALASSQLFATLDPLLRRVRLPSNREAILSDTVGFISKLPTTLVSAFRATLEEIGAASLLLHVIDAASPHFQQQREAVQSVLEDLKLSGKPLLEVYNKVDLVSSKAALPLHGGAVAVSALERRGIEALLERMDELLSADPVIKARFVFSHHQGAALSRLYAQSRLIHRDYREESIYLEVEAPKSLVEQLSEFRVGS
ncbi:MAG: GTPase HflX [Acidobacteriota bacterium]